MAEIKPVSEWFIRPNSELVERLNKQLPRYFYLTPLDLITLTIDYMQQGLLFTKPHSSSSLTSSTSNSDFLEKLKLTLSFTLVYFYPLAGRLETEKYEDEHASRVFIDCNKGPGARLIHAFAPNITIMDVVALNADVPVLVHSLFDFGERARNYDGHTRPLLSVQVTDLADGVFIGISMNHSVGDGTSFLHFLQMWSKIFMTLSNNGDDHIDQLVSMPLNLPIIERPSIFNEYGPTIKVPYLEPSEFIKRGKEPLLRDRIFHFSASTMAILKAKANAECKDKNITISSFQALSALVWRSITRARNLPLEVPTACSFPTNIRPQLDPPMTNNYLGNYVGNVVGTTTVGELLGHNLGWVAKLLHKAGVVNVDDKTARDDLMRLFLEGYSSMMKQWKAIPVGSKHVHINGSARFDVYGLEYGLGRPVAARHGYANRRDGFVAASAGPEGGGSVELNIRLNPQNMDTLLCDEEFMSFFTFSAKL